jgi:hypothetical protein
MSSTITNGLKYDGGGARSGDPGGAPFVAELYEYERQPFLMPLQGGYAMHRKHYAGVVQWSALPIGPKDIENVEGLELTLREQEWNLWIARDMLVHMEQYILTVESTVSHLTAAVKFNNEVKANPNLEKKAYYKLKHQVTDQQGYNRPARLDATGLKPLVHTIPYDDLMDLATADIEAHIVAVQAILSGLDPQQANGSGATYGHAPQQRTEQLLPTVPSRPLNGTLYRDKVAAAPTSRSRPPPSQAYVEHVGKTATVLEQCVEKDQYGKIIGFKLGEFREHYDNCPPYRQPQAQATENETIFLGNIPEGTKGPVTQRMIRATTGIQEQIFVQPLKDPEHPEQGFKTYARAKYETVDEARRVIATINQLKPMEDGSKITASFARKSLDDRRKRRGKVPAVINTRDSDAMPADSDNVGGHGNDISGNTSQNTQQEHHGTSEAESTATKAPEQSMPVNGSAQTPEECTSVHDEMVQQLLHQVANSEPSTHRHLLRAFLTTSVSSKYPLSASDIATSMLTSHENEQLLQLVCNKVDYDDRIQQLMEHTCQEQIIRTAWDKALSIGMEMQRNPQGDWGKILPLHLKPIITELYPDEFSEEMIDSILMLDNNTILYLLRAPATRLQRLLRELFYAMTETDADAAKEAARQRASRQAIMNTPIPPPMTPKQLEILLEEHSNDSTEEKLIRYISPLAEKMHPSRGYDIAESIATRNTVADLLGAARDREALRDKINEANTMLTLGQQTCHALNSLCTITRENEVNGAFNVQSFLSDHLYPVIRMINAEQAHTIIKALNKYSNEQMRLLCSHPHGKLLTILTPTEINQQMPAPQTSQLQDRKHGRTLSDENTTETAPIKAITPSKIQVPLVSDSPEGKRTKHQLSTPQGSDETTPGPTSATPQHDGSSSSESTRSPRPTRIGGKGNRK